MAWKLVITALAISFAAQSTVDGRFLSEAGSLTKVATARQIIDAKTTPQPNYPQSLADNLVRSPMPDAELPSRYDLDVPTQTLTFGVAEIDHLITAGSVDIAVSGHATATLTLVDYKEHLGMQHIRAETNGNIATITRRGASFFATLALSSGSFRLEGEGASSHVFPHQILAARSIRHEVDYRHAP